MAKVTVEQVFRNEKKKDGSPYVDKYGKPYMLVKVLCEGKYVTIWGTKEQTENIKVGDVLEGELKEGEFNGNTTYSLALPKPNPYNERFENIENQINLIWEAIDEIKKK